jgi:hypothetical protein
MNMIVVARESLVALLLLVTAAGFPIPPPPHPASTIHHNQTSGAGKPGAGISGCTIVGKKSASQLADGRFSSFFHTIVGYRRFSPISDELG